MYQNSTFSGAITNYNYTNFGNAGSVSAVFCFTNQKAKTLFFALVS